MLLSALAARALRTRALVRTLIRLYRNGFGWLPGSRVLNPVSWVNTGRRRHLAAHATLLTDAESTLARGRYRRAHPRAWARLRRVIEGAVSHPVTGRPMVRLTMHHPHHS